jgi:hypothetical protein
VFYYFKQRLSVIEQSQMEQARVMQAFIARSIMHQHGGQVNQMNQMMNKMNMNQAQEHTVHKEVNITESGLIEVSSDSESESDDSESESTSSESSDYDNESGSESESKTTKHIQIQLLTDDAVVADVIADIVADAGSSDKKIISLNKTALGNIDDESESESESDDEQSSDHEELQDASFELKIGYKNKDNKETKDNKDSSKIHLNYGNMSVPALRQLAKERGLGGEEADLHKLKKKDLMQLLQ